MVCFKKKMASLQLIDSDGSGYSDSFEIEEESLASSTNSGTTGAVLSQLKATLSNPYGTEKASTPNKGIRVNSASKNKPPLSSSKGVHEHMDFNKTVRSPISLNTTTRMKGRESGSSSKFKSAAQKVQTMQSVSRRFSDSTELRDTVYNGWLADKSAKMSNERRSKQQARREEEMKQRKKEMEISERAVKAVEGWNVTKENELKKKKEERLKRAKLKQQEIEEREQKKEASKSVCETWRERKTQELVESLKEKKRKKLEAKRKKEEEELEKVQSAKLAFNAWNDRKAERMKEEWQKKREKTRQLEATKQEQTLQKKEESKKVVDAWKTKKKKEVTRFKQDATSTSTNVHTRSWCPARSMKYNYPKDPKIANEKTNKASSASESGSVQLDTTYSVSFDSDDDSDDSVDESDLLSTDGGDRYASPKGKRRTIQVCCQVLEYWCTCEDSI